MKQSLLTRFYVIVFLLVASGTAKAGEDAVRPFQFDLKILAKMSINSFNKTTNVGQLLSRIEPQKNRVCVCEIMEAENNNNVFANLVVLSEKENDGDLSKSYRVAEQQISAEKKQMKAIYFDKLRVNTKIAAATDCMSLYLKLNQKNNDFKLYDILNADIRSAVKR